MRQRLFFVASYYAHFTNQAVVIPIITNFKLYILTRSTFNIWEEEKIKIIYAATLTCHGTPSRSIAQHLTSSFLATAVIAIFLRDALPRNNRS